MGSNILWGIVISLFGLNIIFDGVFNFSIPFLRIAIGLFLIYSGLSMLGCHFWKKSSTTFVLSNRNITFINTPKQASSYKTLASNSSFNFSRLSLSDEANISISTTLGTSTLILNPQIPTQINTAVNFGSIDLSQAKEATQEGNRIYFGNKKQIPSLIVNAQLNFGTLLIKSS